MTSANQQAKLGFLVGLWVGPIGPNPMRLKLFRPVRLGLIWAKTNRPVGQPELLNVDFLSISFFIYYYFLK